MNTNTLFTKVLVFAIFANIFFGTSVVAAHDTVTFDQVIENVEPGTDASSSTTISIPELDAVSVTIDDLASTTIDMAIGSTTDSTGAPIITPLAAASQNTITVSTIDTVTLHIRNGDSVVFEGQITVPVNEVVEVADTNNVLHTVPSDSVLAVLKKADESSDAFNISDLVYYSSFNSFLLNCISVGVTNPENKCYNWQFVVDSLYSQVGMDATIVHDGSDIYVYFGSPKRVASIGPTIISGGYFYAKAEKYSYTDNSWQALPDTVVGIVYEDPSNPWSTIEAATSTTDGRGLVLFVAPVAGSYNLGITSDYYYPSTPITVENAGDRITTLLRIRNGDTLVFDDVVILPTVGTVTLEDSHSNSSSLLPQSVLNLLHLADNVSSDVDITDLQYYSSFDAFIVNCLRVTGAADPLCYNWQYVVNGTYHQVGINAYSLQNNDKVYFYFGTQRRLSFATTTITPNTDFTVAAEKYNYENNEWTPLTDVTLGQTVSDPLNPYTPIELATSTVTRLGTATFNIKTAGEYGFGIKEDYYYPLYSITVATSTGSIGGGNGGSSVPIHETPDVEKMLAFLDANQSLDGSFGADLYSDWAALAYGTTNSHNAAKSKLKKFLQEDSLEQPTLTDYERRAMALMALGIDPSNGTLTDYIKNIIDSFDGVQFGDSSLYNDDIFAIIVLRNAGYSETDEKIVKARDYIVAHQNQNGSFDSPDTAGAAIQALVLAGDMTNAYRAKAYLHNIQGVDGGFGNSFSTDWAIQGFAALGVNADMVIKNNKSPLDYLKSLQQADGGIEIASVDKGTRLWATSYAIPATLQMTWNSIMYSYTKNTSVDRGVTTLDNDTSPLVATSTPNTEIPALLTNVSGNTPVIVAATKGESVSKTITQVANENSDQASSTNVVIDSLALVQRRMNKVELLFGGIAISVGVFILIKKWLIKKFYK